MSSAALAVIEDSKYIAVNGQSDITLEELLEANYGGKYPPPHKLPRVTVPGAGGLQWEIPGPTERPVSVASITGVILRLQPTRVRYANPFGVGPVEAPVCKSDDGIIGVGQPGGECAACPLSAFGENGERPVCPESVHAYVILPDRLIPIVIVLPATSLRNVNKYKDGLFAMTKPVYGVETKFSLERKTSGSNKYSVAVLSATDTAISPAERAQYREMGKQIEAYFASRRAAADGE